MSTHLCIDVRMLNASGIGTVIKNTLAHLVGRVRLSLLYLEKDEEQLLSLPGCNLIPMKSAIFSLSEQLELPFKIPRCDLFWSPHFNIPILPIKAKKRLVKLEDVMPLVFFSQLPLHKKIYAKLFYNAALLFSDIVIASTEFSSAEIEKYCFIKKKRTVIANSLSSQFFKRVTKKQKESVRKKYQLPDHFILWVGNVKPHKNLKRLLEAFESFPNEHLVLVGEKENMRTVDREVIQLAEDNKRVIFTGYVQDEEIPVLYALAKLCVFPSLYEGFGYPPLEAMACGCPSVVSNIASLPEVCEDAVEYVDPYNVHSLVSGIQNLIGNEERCQELLKRGKRVLKRFKPENSAADHLKLIESVK